MLRTAASNHDYSGRHCEKGVYYTEVVGMRGYEGLTCEKEWIMNAFRREKRRVVGLCVLTMDF